jgi:hypothetical protein
MPIFSEEYLKTNWQTATKVVLEETRTMLILGQL